MAKSRGRFNKGNRWRLFWLIHQRPRNFNDASLCREKAIYVLMMTVWANSRGSRTLGGTGFQAGQIIFLVAITTICWIKLQTFYYLQQLSSPVWRQSIWYTLWSTGGCHVSAFTQVWKVGLKGGAVPAGGRSLKAVIGRWIRDRWMTQTQSFHRGFTSHTSPTISDGCFESVVTLTQTEIFSQTNT